MHEAFYYVIEFFNTEWFLLKLLGSLVIGFIVHRFFVRIKTTETTLFYEKAPINPDYEKVLDIEAHHQDKSTKRGD